MEINNMSVNIRLPDNGLYCLSLNGAVGKTFLYKLLCGLHATSKYNDIILPLTYDSLRTEDELINKLNNFKGSIIMLDRFDLYWSQKVLDVLYNKDARVLIDLKDNAKLIKTRMRLCRITFDRDSIEVYV